jgi:energy-coupling factor transporter ATP-binding protein EcfA2
VNDLDLAIVTRDLTKTFAVARRHAGRFGALRSFVDPIREHRTVVDKLTMSVAKGELVALLGPNGAGKSTSIKMLTGILTPTSGDYPLSILPRLVQGLFTFVLPLAFVAYFPAEVILGIAPKHGVMSVVTEWSALVGLLLFVLAKRVWAYSLRHYHSAGG